ncbi:MAG TPA: hypothetical protein VFJ72_09785 [Rubrobacteraceae bacterium]|nr:hypothetical protein [Rubrobacteraceae bacterium]
MAPQAKVGIITTIISFAAGVWIFLAPFIVEYQKVGQDWIDATKNDLWTGGALISISALTLILFTAFALRDASRAAERQDASTTDVS